MDRFAFCIEVKYLHVCSLITDESQPASAWELITGTGNTNSE